MDDLQELGITKGQRIAVRSKREEIPNITPVTPGRTNMLILSRSGKQGWLFFFESAADGSIILNRNAYRMQWSADGWTASEGNGGVASYKAIAAYTTELARTSPIHVTLSPRQGLCQLD